MFVSAPFDPERMQINVADEYLWGNWYTFVLIVAGITALVARLAGNLRQRDQELASARQDALQTDRAIALGALASRAAEDLSTPLGTIAILGRDLAHEAQTNETRQQLATLNQAVEECRIILENLALDAGQQKSGKGHAIGADSYLAELIDKWGTRNPGLTPSLKQNGNHPAPEIIADNMLDQAVLTLLETVVEPSGARSPILTGNWTDDKLDIALRIGEAEPAEKEPVTGKINSNLFLAMATLNRLGAEINFPLRDPDGNAIELSIPLSAIRTS
jgi:two-component system sensor histidine kinase RegB